MEFTPWERFTTRLFYRHKCYFWLGPLTWPSDEYFLRAKVFMWLKETVGERDVAWKFEQRHNNFENYREIIHFKRARDKTLFLLRWGNGISS